MRTDFSNNPIVMKTIEFSLMIIDFVEELEEKRKYVLANQILKSGTSIGACVMEAQSAESKADFIHKMKIADKEAHEVWYCLYLCKHSSKYPYRESLSLTLDEIMRLLNAIILSTKAH